MPNHNKTNVAPMRSTNVSVAGNRSSSGERSCNDMLRILAARLEQIGVVDFPSPSYFLEKRVSRREQAPTPNFKRAFRQHPFDASALRHHHAVNYRVIGIGSAPGR